MNDNTQVWDIATRIFHWSLVIFFTLAYLSGDDADVLHAYAGYVIIGLLIFRILWGFIGSRTARFRAFIFSPAETLRYARAFVTRNPIHYIGHNPLAAIMVFALLFSIALTCWTGLEAYAQQGKGPLAADLLSIPVAYADDDHAHAAGATNWEEIHEAAAHLTLLLLFLHIFGVLLASVVHGENLAKSMVTGRREIISSTDPDE